MSDIEGLKQEIEALAAENLAVQIVLMCLLQRIGGVKQELRAPILQAFDDASNHAEDFSLRAGTSAAHLPETLRIIESLRTALVGKGKPAREV